jgi:hypothetical protein
MSESTVPNHSGEQESMQSANRGPAFRTWSIAAPFFSSSSANRWIDDFILDPQWTFRKIPLSSESNDWHSRSKRTTGFAKWLQYWDQSGRALPSSGLITVFPQPALMAAVRKRLHDCDIPLVAWCFNLGQYPHGLKRAAARLALRSVDRFVVHSRGEIVRVSEFLDIPPAKVEFVPLQRSAIPIDTPEDVNAPFILAMGSANRDYSTFFKAAQISDLPCKVVASPRSLEGLRVPPGVSVESGLTALQCRRLVQQSRFSVVPLLDPNIASGQVTVVEAIRMNKPVIATQNIGTTDYIQNGQSGTLVPPNRPEELAAAMLQLWDDAGLRERYAKNAAEFGEESLSDAAAGRALTRILSELEAGR